MPNLSSQLRPLTFLNSLSATGQNVDFPGIPSWARRITVYLDAIRSTGNTPRLVQLGTSTGIINTGYSSHWMYAASTPGASVGSSGSNAGFGIHNGNPIDILYATMTITNIGNNRWVGTHEGSFYNGTYHFGITGGGRITMSGVVDRVRITSVGTESFNNGVFGLSYE